MNSKATYGLLLSGSLLLAACGGDMPAGDTGITDASAADYPRGPHGARLLQDGDFAVELAIYESGVPPEFRAWAYEDGEPVAPQSVDLRVTLERLDALNVIGFNPQEDYLRGDTTVYEPHSFFVGVEANYRGSRHTWEYESLEGRTTISPAMSQTFGIETETAGPAILEQTIDVVGEIAVNDEFARHISARFDGVVQEVNVRIGDRVARGDPLLTIESNESLNTYTIDAPIAGVVTQRRINAGEQSDGQVLLEIMDTSRVWGELAVYPGQRDRVQVGAPVTITSPVSGARIEGSIDSFHLTANANQSVTARVAVDNSDGNFPPGTFIEGRISVAEFEVPLAVKRVGLQSFRDFTVVYAKVGNTYEVRMLDLGRQDAEWVEVLGGLDPGTEYVTTHSYILKADVEKSGASHDH